ncbi:serine/threonine-protein kinase AtPK2/AtPK19-like [Carica papaya]|uniref:serine/threonine-protein kinase AtPK2/AtPK19-like n=1 Tax=Carica papaya TaxID=3649 RepID=UPI000B8C79E2|nr:serine/threonine-protein kinase AtPK2/AtPK19-like [Carica papaya]
MVSSQLAGLSGKNMCKPLQNNMLFAMNLPDAVVTDNIELDFSDVFGPLPVQTPTETTRVDQGNFMTSDASELVYDDPPVLYRRSHSLVGPSSCVSQSLKLSKLTLHENEDTVDLLECVNGESITEVEEQTINDILENSLKPLEGNSTKTSAVSIENFEVLKVVGQGAFGKVYQVRKKGTSEIYAMKVMRKDRIMEKNHAGYMIAERDILTKIDHPFIVQLKFSFQTKYRLYLCAWNFVNGGTVMLTDFGLAKEFNENTRSNSMCGTVEYMSPEIVLGKGHDKAADWWSVGILLYEMLTGKPPFLGNREKIQRKIVKDKIKLPGFLTSEAHSLLKGLLQKDPSKRLGSGATGSEEIKRHKWFKPINWKKLEAREVQPSFRPEVAGQLCIANFEKRWTDMPLLDSPAASPKTNVNPFVDFTYVRPPASFLHRNSPVC